MFINGLTGAILMIVSIICWWRNIISSKAFIFIMCVLLVMMGFGIGAIYYAYIPEESEPIYQTIISSYYPLIISSIISLLIVFYKFHHPDK